MKSPLKFSFFVSLLMSLIILAGCSHAIGTGGCTVNCGGGGGGPFTIGGTVSGLAAGGSLTLRNNRAARLGGSAQRPFTFKTAVRAHPPSLVTGSVSPPTPPP